MLLAGYQPLLPRGFALPCFGTAPVPNRWYVALSTVEGDHQARIAEFEPFDSDHIVHLAGDLVSVAPGDCWRDVFLHDGEAFTGTADDILKQLGIDRLEALKADYPFEALDLFLAAGRPQSTDLMRSAKAAVAEQHGEVRADSWLGQLIIRPQARVEVRRRLVEAGLSKRQREARAIQVQAQGDGWSLSAPRSLVAILERAGAGEALRDAAARISAALALSISVNEPQGGLRVRAMRVNGQVRTPVDTIIAASGIVIGNALTDDLLNRAADRVSAMGAFDSVIITHDEGMVLLEVRERPIVDAILIGGVERLSVDHIRGHIPFEPGSVFHPDLLSQCAERIQAVYEAADIEVEVNFEVRTLSTSDSVTIQIHIDEQLDRRPTNAETDIFVLPIGRGSRTIARAIGQPDWSPLSDRFYSTRATTSPTPPSRFGPPLRIDVGHRGEFPDPTSYRVLVIIAEDDPVEVSVRLHELEAAVHRSGRRSPSILIVPILPAQKPSKLLLEKDIGSTQLPIFMLDTSVLRSPFWRAGSPPAALRTLGDYAVGAAMLIATNAVPLGHHSRKHVVPILAFTTQADAAPVRLMSETDPGRLTDIRRKDDDVFRFPVFPVRGVSDPMEGYALVSGATGLGAFEDFAAAALQRALRKKTPGGLRKRSRLRPGPWSESLAEPQLATILDKEDGVVAGDGQALVLAEAPTLDQIVRAEAQGMAAVRYTDAATLRKLGELSSMPPLPLDIALPDLHIWRPALASVARGADVGRTVRRIPRDMFTSLIEDSRSPFADRVRGLRTSVDDIWPAHVAAPLWETVEFGRAGGDPVARAFLRYSPDSIGRLPSYTQPRGWIPPLPGADRFVISTVLTGLAVAHLPNDQVAGARLLQIDGDLVVPWILTSRLFQIWVRATCSSVNGRYRLTARAIESFPWPGWVHFRREGEGIPPALELMDRRLHQRLQKFDRELWRGPVIASGSDSRVGEAPDLEAALFEAYSLRPYVSDIQILDRLVDMNLHAPSSMAWPNMM